MARTPKPSPIKKAIYTIIADHFCVRNPETLQDTDTVESLDGDSLDAVELVMIFEDHFEVEISEATSDTWKTVGDAVAYFEGEAERKRKNELAAADRAKQNPDYEVPGMNNAAQKVLASFRMAAIAMTNNVFAQTRKVVAAEQKVITKADASVEKADALVKAIKADPAPKAKPVTQGAQHKQAIVGDHVISKDRFYVTRTAYTANKTNVTIVKGPYLTMRYAFVAAQGMRNNRQNIAFNVALGKRLIMNDVKFAPSYETPVLLPLKVRAESKPVTQSEVLGRRIRVQGKFLGVVKVQRRANTDGIGSTLMAITGEGIQLVMSAIQRKPNGVFAYAPL